MDIAMLVSTTSKQEIDPRDRSKISDSLILEAGTDPTLAEQTALAVEDLIDTSNLMLRAAQACSRHLPCVILGLASQETGAGE